jgi:Na+-exporting ATPase
METEVAVHVISSRFSTRFSMGKEELISTLDIHLATEFSFDSKVKKWNVVYKANLTGLIDVYSKVD